jgi:hypothetical protein
MTIKKRRKFRKGGSVMDTPSRDMRNPAYRKQLEKEQALETSTEDIEFLLGGMGLKKALGALGKDFQKNALAKAPSRSLNLEIGSKTPEAIYKKELDRLRSITKGLPVPEETLIEKAKYWTNYELKKLKKKPLPDRSKLVKDEAKEKALKVADRAIKAATLEQGPKVLRKLTASEEEPSPMKKGGLAQKRKQPVKAKVTVKKKTVAVKTKTKRAR